jgi:hypothetical protein
MDEENTIIPLAPKMGEGVLLFGLRSDDPVLRDMGPALGLPAMMIEVDCQSLTAAALQRGPVRRAICPLFAAPSDPQSDAIAVIEALAALGFAGEVVVLAPPLLRPKMVEGELRAISRALRVRLMAGVLPPLTEI